MKRLPMKPLNVAIAILLGLAGPALAEEAAAPPQGAVSLLEVAAKGVQIYACQAKDQGYAWVFRAPEATLFDAQGRPLGTHGAGPIWKLTDGSAVIGEKVAEAASPDPHSIPWLLLRAKSHEGAGQLAEAAWIRRANTQGGAAPSGGCDATHAGETARVPYSATYQFFH